MTASDGRRANGCVCGKGCRRRARLAAAILWLGVAAGFASPTSAQVYAGGTQISISGPWSADPGQGSSAYGPVGVATDTAGNIYIGEHVAHDIVEVNAQTHSSSVYISSSTSVCGYTLGRTQFLAADASNNLYIADPTNNQIFVYSIPNSSCTAHYGASSPFGIAIDSSGNIYYTDYNGGGVYRISVGASSGTSGTAIITGGNLYGIAFEPSNANLLVSDGSSTIYSYTYSSGYASSSQAVFLSGLSSPYGLCFDSSANLLVALTGSNQVVKYLYSTGYATSVQLTPDLTGAEGIGVDRSGNLFLTAYTGNTVTEISNGSFGFGQVPVGTTSAAVGVNFEVVSGTTIGSIQYLDQGATGQQFQALSPDSNPNLCTASAYVSTQACTVDVTFTPAHPGVRHGAVEILDANNNVLATAFISGTGTGPQLGFTPPTPSALISGLNQPFGIAFDGKGNLFEADYGTGAVKEFLAASGYVTALNLAHVNEVGGMAIDGAGNIFFSGYGTGYVYEALAAGGYTTVNIVGSGYFYRPFGVAVDGSGNLFVANRGFNEVMEIPYSGGSYGSPVSLGSGFSNPYSVALDASGNIYVADAGNNAVKEIVKAGGYTTVATLATVTGIQAVTVDGNGNVYAAIRSSNSSVSEILAVNGSIPSSPTIITLRQDAGGPETVALDASGNVYYGTSGTTVITKLDYADPPTLPFASTAVGSTSSDSPRTLTITNSGNADLTFPAPLSGDNPSISADFTIGSSSTCPQLTASSSPATLAAGLSCSDLISFSPTAAGPISGVLALTDDALNVAGAVQPVVLQGSATPGTQTITFPQPASPAILPGSPSAALAATASSGLAVTYTVLSGPATVSGSTITYTGGGTVVMEAGQAGNASYFAAAAVQRSVVVELNPTLTFTVANQTYGAAPFAVSASSPSSGAIAYDVASGPATIAGHTVKLTGVGTVVLRASQAADGSYIAATADTSFTVAGEALTLAFTPIAAQIYGAAPFTVSATSASNGVITYAVVSGPATTAGQTVTLTGAGTVTLRASQAAAANYSAATATISFTVAAETPTLAFAPIAAQTYGAAPFAVSASSASYGAITYAVVSGPATLAGRTVTLTGAGTVVLSASQTGSEGYAAATAAISFTVAPEAPTLVFSPIPAQTYGAAPFVVSASSASNGAITYAVVSGPATIAGQLVMVTGAGTVILSASQGASVNYARAMATTNFTVAADFALAPSPSSGSGSGTTVPGGAAAYTLTLTPGGGPTYPDALSLSASGLPTGATAIFSPQTIAAGSGVTTVTLTIQTEKGHAASTRQPFSAEVTGGLALGFLLLPLAGLKRMRRLLRQASHLPLVLTAAALSLAAVGLSGCGSNGFFNQTAQSYTVKVTATDVVTGARSSTNVILTVQ